MDCSLPGSSLHGILQARVLEWVVISFSKGSSRPRDQTRVSWIPGKRFNLWATREADPLKRPWCWERLRAGGEEGNRGWDSWMASLTPWTWVWVDSGSWWWTGRPGVLRFMKSQRVRHDWVTEVKWSNIVNSSMTKEVRLHSGEKRVSSVNSDGRTTHTCIRITLESFLSPSTKGTSQWIKRFRVKLEAINC